MVKTRLSLFVLAWLLPVLGLMGLATAVLPPLTTTHAAPANTITVTSLNNSGTGSLRQAIANVAPGGTINFSVSGTILLTSELLINKNLTINGGGAITISGNNTTRVFNITAGHVTFDSLNIINGSVQTNDCGLFPTTKCGGGIISQNSSVAVTVTNSTLSGNSAINGGGIYSHGSLTIVNSTIEKNSADWGGGVYYMDLLNQTMLVSHSTFYSNTALSGVGGGIYVSGRLMVDNSTFAHNTAGWNGGGIGNGSNSTIEIRNSTIAHNTTDADNNGTGDGGGISAFSTTVITITNTIISHNYDLGGEAPDCAETNQLHNGGIYSEGYNLIGDTTGCNLDVQPTDLWAVNPLLGVFADYGGPTWTYLLQMGSPAINHIPAALCQAQTDQRGVARPQGGRCEIGAVEMEGIMAVYALTVALAGDGSGTVSSDPAGIACGAICELPDLVEGSVVTLTAVASPGATFTGWSGDVVTTTNPITVTMDSAKAITATFALAPAPTVTLSENCTNTNLFGTNIQGEGWLPNTVVSMFWNDGNVLIPVADDEGNFQVGWSVGSIYWVNANVQAVNELRFTQAEGETRTETVTRPCLTQPDFIISKPQLTSPLLPNTPLTFSMEVTNIGTRDVVQIRQGENVRVHLFINPTNIQESFIPPEQHVGIATFASLAVGQTQQLSITTLGSFQGLPDVDAPFTVCVVVDNHDHLNFSHQGYDELDETNNMACTTTASPTLYLPIIMQAADAP